jgi:hypothetical protein
VKGALFQGSCTSKTQIELQIFVSGHEGRVCVIEEFQIFLTIVGVCLFFSTKNDTKRVKLIKNAKFNVKSSLTSGTE